MRLSVACLVLPEELAAKLLTTQPGRGWLRGWRRARERLYVVPAAVADGTDTLLVVEASERLFRHHAVTLGGLDEQLMRWVVVRAGFREALESDGIAAIDALAGWTVAGIESGELMHGGLFLCCVEEGAAGPVVSLVLATTRDGAEVDLIVSNEVELIATTPNPFLRLDGLAPLAALRTRRVAVIGVGSGGGVIALDLAAAGVGTLHLIDRDRLTSANLFRHVCGRDDLGRQKVRAVADLIASHDLPTRVEPHAIDVLDAPDELRAIAGQVDVVVAATDEVDSRRLVNYVGVRAGVPVVLAATFDGARIGEVIRVLPGRTACYECVRLRLRERGSLEPIPTDDRHPLAQYGAQPDQPDTPRIRALRTDVALVAGLAARAALMTLLADQPEMLGVLPRSYLTWSAVRTLEYPEPFYLPTPFTANFADLPRRIDCPVCGHHPEDLVGVDIDGRYAEIMGPLLAAEQG